MKSVRKFVLDPGIFYFLMHGIHTLLGHSIKVNGHYFEFCNSTIFSLILLKIFIWTEWKVLLGCFMNLMNIWDVWEYMGLEELLFETRVLTLIHLGLHIMSYLLY